MNPYTQVEDFFKDLLKYVDLMLACYSEATQHHSSEYVIGWKLKQYNDAAVKYHDEAETTLSEMEARLEDTKSTSTFIPLAHVTETFKLNAFERFCLYLCMSVELDPSFEKSVRFFNDSLDSPFPTLGLALKIYCIDMETYMEERALLNSNSKLIKYFFIDSFSDRQGQPLIGVPLMLDHSMVDYLVNFQNYEVNSPYMKAVYPNTLPDNHSFEILEQQLHEFFIENHEKRLNKNLLFYLNGPKGIGKHALVYHFCNAYEQTAIVVDCKYLTPTTINATSQIAKICREALLNRATLVFDHFDVLTESLSEPLYSQFLEQLIASIRSFAKVSFALSEIPWHPQTEYADLSIVEVPLQIPNALERLALWENLSKSYPIADDVNLEEIANQFKLTHKQIEKSLKDAQNYKLWHQMSHIDRKTLHQANYFQLAHNLCDNAQRIHSNYVWSDLVLPPDQSLQLQEACNQVRYKHIVFSKWGFNTKITYGNGLGMLFTGPPGTGKTLAAQVIANTLNLELYRVDLSQIISKYIGETEKNLKRIFDEAALSNAILLFDEGDALFSKRTEVSDAHDKYANVETSYLLQKIEAYEGLSIVTTNLLGNIDEAFIRRFSFVVHFPFPTPEYRRTIWRQVFPKEAPLSKTIDFEYLGDRFELSGGNIKNVALNAAFIAASKDREITMRDLLRSVAAEISKTGKAVLASDFGEYAYLLTQPEF